MGIDNTKTELYKEVLLEKDLGVNFNGYPLEDESETFLVEVEKTLIENNCKRMPKNRKYKLKLIIEEY